MYTFNTLWIRYGYVHSNTDVDFSDAIRWEVGRSWTLTIFELFFVYVGIRSGHTPWCDRAIKDLQGPLQTELKGPEYLPSF